jgi:uncharacterized protein (DUF488 family)
MERFGKEFARRRSVNGAAIERAFGVAVAASATTGQSTTYRTVRAGGRTTIFTIGYERRDGEELISLLRNAGVELLADIREKPFSRVPDFRAGALRGFCNNAGIEYRSWPELGSTGKLRENLKATGDFKRFESGFRSHLLMRGQQSLEELATEAKKKATVLLCYERRHEECHRSTVAELLADRLDAGIVAM